MKFWKLQGTRTCTGGEHCITKMDFQWFPCRKQETKTNTQFHICHIKNYSRQRQWWNLWISEVDLRWKNICCLLFCFSFFKGGRNQDLMQKKKLFPNNRVLRWVPLSNRLIHQYLMISLELIVLVLILCSDDDVVK